MVIRNWLKHLLPNHAPAAAPSPAPNVRPKVPQATQHNEHLRAAHQTLGTQPASSAQPRKNLLPPMPPHPAPNKPQRPSAAAEQTRDPSVTHLLTQPSYRSSTTVRFTVPEPQGKELKPHERWLVQLPADMQGSALRTVILGHRKDAKYRTSVTERGFDNEGAYNLIEARDTQSGEWLVWRDRYGAKKFAEPRDDIEHENLHDWPNVVGMRQTDLISITGVGQGKNAVANVHFIEVEVFPIGKVETTQKEVFTPGTRFATQSQPKPGFGGGHNCVRSPEQLDLEGLYPNALAFPAQAQQVSATSYIDDNGAYRIKLPAGKVFGGFEISIGDTVFDPNKPAQEQRNKDGHFGAIGHTKMNVAYHRPGQPEELFMQNFGIPPSGVLSGGPKEAGHTTQAGDEIVLRFDDAAFIMGYQIQFMQPGSVPKG